MAPPDGSKGVRPTLFIEGVPELVAGCWRREDSATWAAPAHCATPHARVTEHHSPGASASCLQAHQGQAGGHPLLAAGWYDPPCRIGEGRGRPRRHRWLRADPALRAEVEQAEAEGELAATEVVLRAAMSARRRPADLERRARPEVEVDVPAMAERLAAEEGLDAAETLGEYARLEERERLYHERPAGDQ